MLAPEEGIYLSLKALLMSGDHVVVTYPGYQALYEVARSIGCKLSYWQPQLNSGGNWSFDVQHLDRLVRWDTKVESGSIYGLNLAAQSSIGKEDHPMICRR